MKKPILLLAIFLIAQALFAQQKYALVIGNSNYTGIGTLKNPVNDANDMEAALKTLGFTDVIKVLNGSQTEMLTAIANFKRRLGSSANSYGFFYYAGHGVQYNGVNYLIPVNAQNITSAPSLQSYSVSLQQILDELNEAGNELNMVVLDACRDNPFSWDRSGGRGLTVLSRAPPGSIVMYAAGAGQTADDGTGSNGLFTGQLLNNLKTPGLSVYEIFDKTMGDVKRMTNGRQDPELSLKFSGANSIYLGSRPVNPGPSPTPTPNPNPVPNNMVRINGGTFMMGSPDSEVDRSISEIQHSVTLSSFYMGKYEVTQKEYEEVMGTNPSNFKGDNLPVESVSWYDAIDYCNRLSQREGLTPAYTVNGENVTWNQNANGYRLPTEEEWEYACRAGRTTPFSTGNNITTGQANYNGNYPYNNNAKGTYLEKTTPVGSFAPNPWGLYDMHGNVWEWCWDIYSTYVSQSQEDKESGYSIYLAGGGQQSSSGSARVIRGGCWFSVAQLLRSASRFYDAPSYRHDGVGFRVVRP
ncbi:MAG: SUMF1/EgtB/PvdO family nonheme iron enzyme [Treponema sp.]|jgi:formylglycine-generating enzyme required for sulfatase activity|nr:SUMF1/EgtB/PvdO family nonheme iron enzyme [Treponema sp.]